MKVILINGSCRVGKSNFVKYFSKQCDGKIDEIDTVGVIKNVMKKHFGWNGKKDDASRLMMSEMKKLWTKFNDGPFLDTVEKITKSESDYVFIHCREPKEIQKFKEFYGKDMITILLIKEDREVANNDSDKNVANYEYDYTIYNDTDKIGLKLKAKELHNRLKKEGVI